MKKVFHAMEKFFANFPRHGKKFSTPWKNLARRPPFHQKFSMLWKYIFHTVENVTPLPEH